MVVLVEDNPVDVDLVQMAFARTDDPPELIVFESAEDALAAPEELATASVIAIDLSLPGMSGQQLSVTLHEQGIGPTLLLAMSDHHAGLLIEEVVCNGATAKTLTCEKISAFLAAISESDGPVVI